MNTSIISLLPLSIILLASCGGTSDPTKSAVVFSDIICPSIETSLTSDEPRNSVLNSPEELEAVWVELNGVEGDIPEIDFDAGTAVLVYGGYKGTSNEWVEISGISRFENGEIEVHYNNYSAQFDNCGGSAVITHPLCIVQTTSQFNDAEFKSTTLNSCEAND